MLVTIIILLCVCFVAAKEKPKKVEGAVKYNKANAGYKTVALGLSKVDVLKRITDDNTYDEVYYYEQGESWKYMISAKVYLDKYPFLVFFIFDNEFKLYRIHLANYNLTMPESPMTFKPSLSDISAITDSFKDKFGDPAAVSEFGSGVSLTKFVWLDKGNRNIERILKYESLYETSVVTGERALMPEYKIEITISELERLKKYQAENKKILNKDF